MSHAAQIEWREFERAKAAPLVRRWLLVGLLFCVAFEIRLLYVFTDLTIPLINDMGVYSQLASSMLAGEGYVSDLEPHFLSLRAPGYPFFLLGVYALFGQSALAVLSLHALMGAATCVLVYAIGRDVSGRVTGLLAGALCALNPEAIHWTREFLTETLFTLLLATSVWAAMALVRTGHKRWIVTVGLTLGFATLVRANVLLFIPVVVLYVAYCAPSPMRSRLAACAAICGLVVVVLTPWTIRNYVVHDAFVPVATIGGMALYVSLPADESSLESLLPMPIQLERGRHALPSGYSLVPELMGRETEQRLPDGFSEVEETRAGQTLYLQYVLEDPLRTLTLMRVKLSMIFNPLPRTYSQDFEVDYGFGEWDVVVQYAAALFFLYLFVFGALGAIETFALRSPALLLHGLALYQIGFLLIFRPALRYLLPGLLICSVFAAHGTLAAGRLRESFAGHSSAQRGRFALWAVLTVALLSNAWHHVFVLRADQTADAIDRIAGLLGFG